MNKNIILLFLVNISSAVGYSLIAPLFPSIALEKGLSEAIIGIIIASFAVSNSIITPYCHKIFSIYGKKKVFFFGLLSEVCFIFLYLFQKKLFCY